MAGTPPPQQRRFVRIPDPSGCVPRNQCGGDWGFWYESALEFLEDTESRFASLGDRVEAAAHSVKTAAELLGMSEVSFAAYDIENESKNHAEPVRVAELLDVLRLRVAAMKAVLLDERVKSDPVAALAAVDGRYDALLTPLATRRGSDMPPQSAPSTANLTDHSELAASLSEFPRRIAICAEDNTMRVLVTSILVDTGAYVASFGDVSELNGFDAETVVIIFGSIISLHDLNFLPRTETTSGRSRSYVLVGEIDPVIEQAVSKSKWATTCRVPIQPAELVMKIGTIYAATITAGDEGHSKLLVV